MTDADRWLTDFGDRQRDLIYPMLYWLAVPLLVLGTVGLLWSLPTPIAFVDISPVLNWATAFLMAATVYYFIISLSLAIGMLPIVFAIAAFEFWLENSGWPLRRTSAGLLLVGVIGVYLGHFAKGSTSAVVRHIQLMMIAPVWALSNLYRRLGIPY